MQATRDAAGRLAQQGRIEITQKGVAVHLSEVKGPIRLRLTVSARASAEQDAGAVQDPPQPMKRRKIDS